MQPREDIQQQIFHAFGKPELLERALTHSSYANEHRVLSHNERMEFLGDAILNFVISEHLMQLCPDATEGDLSRLRASLVSETSLAEIARKIQLGRYLLLGKGEEQTGGRDKESILANCLEALIAAVYLDAGMEPSRAFVIRFFGDNIRKASSTGMTLDYKTELQERCQEHLKQLPEYRVISESGPDHQKQFEVEIRINNDVLGRGSGKSKKEAEQHAAQAALSHLTNGGPAEVSGSQ
jgi:ribonuclease III